MAAGQTAGAQERTLKQALRLAVFKIWRPRRRVD